MSYTKLADLAQDSDIQRRAMACAASIGVADPFELIVDNRWKLAAHPGMVEAYAASDSDAPGADESAVTDAMIIEAVKEMNAGSGA